MPGGVRAMRGEGAAGYGAMRGQVVGERGYGSAVRARSWIADSAWCRRELRSSMVSSQMYIS